MVLWPGAVAWTLWGEPVTHSWFLTVQLIIAVLVILHLLLSEDSAYLRALSNPAVAWLGRVSYSWYLWQQLFVVFDHPARARFHAFPLNVATSFLVAVASYYWVERPFLRLKERIGKSKPQYITPLPWLGSAAEPL
jgi:peptidoglycan/LPS O-acetylase OafA/YrhL